MELSPGLMFKQMLTPPWQHVNTTSWTDRQVHCVSEHSSGISSAEYEYPGGQGEYVLLRNV